MCVSPSGVALSIEINTCVRLFHPSTHLRSVELGMRKESRVISHFHTSDKCRTKDEKGK